MSFCRAPRWTSGPAAMSTTRACAASRGSSALASVASRLAPRRPRATPPPRASSSDDASTSPWWASLPAVHVLVFNPETDEEALYTTSRRDGDFAANDFVAFESLQDATRASVRVSDQLGEMPIVDTVDPRVVAFLAERCGYGVDVVPAGTSFEPPAVVIDESGVGKDLETRDAETRGTEELAISTVDLQKYLAIGGDLAPMASFDEGETAKTEDARRRAASAMRAALTSPARRVRGAVLDVARAPARSMMTPMRAIQRSVRRAAGAPEGRERLDPLWDEQVPMPSAAQAVYRALIVLAEKRLNEMDD